MKDKELSNAKHLVISNLGQLRTSLNNCIDEGLIDSESHYYNEIVDLLTDAEMLSSWDELMDLVFVAKNLEVDIDTWLALKGKTSLSLDWPQKNTTQ